MPCAPPRRPKQVSILQVDWPEVRRSDTFGAALRLYHSDTPRVVGRLQV
jgi:hypothetical protein